MSLLVVESEQPSSDLKTFTMIPGTILLMSRKRAAAKATPIIDAILARDAGLLEVTLQSGADVNDVDADGRSALHHAVINGDSAAVQRLLKHGVSPMELAQGIANYDVKKWLT